MQVAITQLDKKNSKVSYLNPIRFKTAELDSNTRICHFGKVLKKSAQTAESEVLKNKLCVLK